MATRHDTCEHLNHYALFKYPILSSPIARRDTWSEMQNSNGRWLIYLITTMFLVNFQLSVDEIIKGPHRRPANFII